MEESLLKKLWKDLVLSDLIGSTQRRELIYNDPADRNFKIYIYNEPNHNKPHIHIYYRKDYKVSITITDGDILAGSIPNKNLKVVRNWLSINEHKLLKDWENIQDGRKPEFKWSKFA